MNKARVLSDAFQAAEIELDELCKATFVTYKKFHLYESREETKKRREMLRAQIKRFVLYETRRGVLVLTISLSIYLP